MQLDVSLLIIKITIRQRASDFFLATIPAKFLGNILALLLSSDPFVFFVGNVPAIFLDTVPAIFWANVPTIFVGNALATLLNSCPAILLSSAPYDREGANSSQGY